MAKTSKLDDLRIDRSDEPRNRHHWLPVALVAVVVVAIVALWWWARPGAARVRTETVRSLTPGSSEAVLNASGYVTARRQGHGVLQGHRQGGRGAHRGGHGGGQKVRSWPPWIDAFDVGRHLNLAEAQLEAAQGALAETRVRLVEAEKNLVRMAGPPGPRASPARPIWTLSRPALDALAARLERQEKEVGVARRQLALRQQELADTVIRAPFAGVVVSKDAQPGEMISPVSAGRRLHPYRHLHARGHELPGDRGGRQRELHQSSVKPDQPVEATLDAYPDWKIPARVIAIVPTADRQKATVRVRIGFDELDPRILPDMGVKVAFLEDEAR